MGPPHVLTRHKIYVVFTGYFDFTTKPINNILSLFYFFILKLVGLSLFYFCFDKERMKHIRSEEQKITFIIEDTTFKS